MHPWPIAPGLQAMSDAMNVLDILFILQTEAIYDEDMGA